MIILSLICIAIIIKVIIILISGFKSKKNNINDNDEYSHLENNNTITPEISEFSKNFEPTVPTENAETPETQQNSQTFQVPQPHQIDYKNFYKPKRYLITLNELKFYNILLEIAKELDLILFSQVSLYNILETRNNLDYRTKVKYFNKISSKTIDFVLVDKTNCRIKLCIELDDSTHNNPKRVERDLFINKLFQDLEIDLLRYPVYNVYYKETLKKRIVDSIKEHYYSD